MPDEIQVECHECGQPAVYGFLSMLLAGRVMMGPDPDASQGALFLGPLFDN